MTDISELNTKAAELAKEAGHRYTTGRQQIVEALNQLSKPVSIEEILETDSSLAQSSVYRNIEALKEAGVVKAIAAGSDTTRFELSDTLSHHHHHMICNNCNSINGFELSAKLEAALHKELDKAASRSGFSSESHILDIHGLCGSCS